MERILGIIAGATHDVDMTSDLDTSPLGVAAVLFGFAGLAFPWLDPALGPWLIYGAGMLGWSMSGSNCWRR
jgi:hypothetical protein